MRGARLGDIEGYERRGPAAWRPIRSALGIDAFGVNAWAATAAGQQLIGEHDEVGQGAAATRSSTS